MDPDSAEATALMELAPTPVDITEITGAVFIFEREDSEPAPDVDPLGSSQPLGGAMADAAPSPASSPRRRQASSSAARTRVRCAP